MLFKIWDLVIIACLLILAGCDDNKKEQEYDELDRMAKETTQPLEHQNIAEETGVLDAMVDIR
jgi:PBP1b-binding outer membrane lipoprotein LpoB